MARMCARCGVNIDHRDIRSRHCSALCRDRDRDGAVAGTIRACLRCDTTFAATKGTHVYCSRLCRSRADVDRNRSAYNQRNAARRARERGADVGEAFTREDVFDRDGWMCQLCLSPIDWRITGRDPRAPALDHKVPLILGGRHSLSNVQASHFGCNASKSDRLLGELDLIAPPHTRAA